MQYANIPDDGCGSKIFLCIKFPLLIIEMHVTLIRLGFTYLIWKDRPVKLGTIAKTFQLYNKNNRNLYDDCKSKFIATIENTFLFLTPETLQ